MQLIWRRVHGLLFFILLLLPGIGLALPKTGNPYSSNRLTDTLPAVDSAIYQAVETEAYFPGGIDAWRTYLEQNLDPDVPIKKGAPEGTYVVIIQFVVGTDGKISDITPLTKHGFGMEAEVMRIIRKSPPWVAAVQDKRPVKAYRKQPITFSVAVEKKKKRQRP